MNFTPFIKAALCFSAMVFFVSCDKDFNEIGSEVVGDDHFLFDKDDTKTVVANTVATGAVQSNNLPVNPLGIYSNPTFGTTTANFVTQVELASVNPVFTNINEPPVIETVELYIPYFSTLEDTDSNGDHTYSLDSIYGPENGRMNLAIYESNFFLRDIDYNDQNEQQLQRYYSDQNSDITHGTNLLNDATVTSENTEFAFSPLEIKEETTDDDGDVKTTRRKPGMRLQLDKDFFYEKIINAPAGALQGNNAFRNYFRGLYFSVSQSGTAVPSMAMLDFAQGTITMKYKQDLSVTTDGVTTISRVDKSLVLKLTGNTVSLLNHENSPEYTTGLAQPYDATLGQNLLYLKGGAGSVAVIDLFGADGDDADTVPEELEEIRENNWLINEASLTFFIERDKMGLTTPEPLRIYLYDLNNKRPVIDYYYDNSTGGTKFNKNIHSGIIVKEDVDNGRGIKYKVRITNYLRSLIQNDSTNVRLGLSVTETINNINNSKLRVGNETLNDYVPAASVMNPLGTILHGTGPGVPEDKKLKLEIYYTKPNE